MIQPHKPRQRARLARRAVDLLPESIAGRIYVERGRRTSDPELQLLKSLLRRGDLFVDVGANAGLYARAAILCGASTVCFEPLPEMAQRLRRIVGANGSVFEAAVGLEDGMIEIYVPRLGGELVLTRASTLPDANEGAQSESIRVKSMRLDDEAWPSELRMIKIDVEGAEHDVLKSGQSMLAQKNPIVLVEIEYRHGPEQADAAFGLLDELDYIGPYVVRPNRTLRQIERAEIRSSQMKLPGKDPFVSAKGGYINNFVFFPGRSSSQDLARLTSGSWTVEQLDSKMG